jgi:UDP:flavonoid glycosyltransferase YjiC (YdhE family)
MSLRSLRKGHLQDAIKKVLNDKRYKLAMEHLQVWQSKRDGALEVVKAVRELISSREQQPDCHIA